MFTKVETPHFVAHDPAFIGWTPIKKTVQEGFGYNQFAHVGLMAGAPLVQSNPDTFFSHLIPEMKASTLNLIGENDEGLDKFDGHLHVSRKNLGGEDFMAAKGEVSENYIGADLNRFLHDPNGFVQGNGVGGMSDAMELRKELKDFQDELRAQNIPSNMISELTKEYLKEKVTARARAKAGDGLGELDNDQQILDDDAISRLVDDFESDNFTGSDETTVASNIMQRRIRQQQIQDLQNFSNTLANAVGNQGATSHSVASARTTNLARQRAAHKSDVARTAPINSDSSSTGSSQNKGIITDPLLVQTNGGARQGIKERAKIATFKDVTVGGKIVGKKLNTTSQVTETVTDPFAKSSKVPRTPVKAGTKTTGKATKSATAAGYGANPELGKSQEKGVLKKGGRYFDSNGNLLDRKDMPRKLARAFTNVKTYVDDNMAKIIGAFKEKYPDKKDRPTINQLISFRASQVRGEIGDTSSLYTVKSKKSAVAAPIKEKKPKKAKSLGK